MMNLQPTAKWRTCSNHDAHLFMIFFILFWTVGVLGTKRTLAVMWLHLYCISVSVELLRVSNKCEMAGWLWRILTQTYELIHSEKPAKSSGSLLWFFFFCDDVWSAQTSSHGVVGNLTGCFSEDVRHTVVGCSVLLLFLLLLVLIAFFSSCHIEFSLSFPRHFGGCVKQTGQLME